MGVKLHLQTHSLRMTERSYEIYKHWNKFNKKEETMKIKKNLVSNLMLNQNEKKNLIN